MHIQIAHVNMSSLLKMNSLRKLLCKIGLHTWTWSLKEAMRRDPNYSIECEPPDFARCKYCRAHYE